MQQAYVELLSGNARFKRQSSLKTFVFSVVQNLARSRYRRMATRLRLLREHAHESDNEISPAESESNSEVWAAVKSLPARQRDVIELVFCRELTIEQASRVMGVSVGTGRVHYERAKKSLRARMQQSPDQPI